MVGLVTGALCAGRGRGAGRHGQARLPRARADAARADAAGQLALLVLRARPRQPGLPQRHHLDADPACPRWCSCCGYVTTAPCSGSSWSGGRRRPSPACVGPLQARVIPRLPSAWEWVSQHRDLGLRYLAENTSNSGAGQLRIYGVGIIAGPGGGRLRPGGRAADGPVHGHLHGHIAGHRPRGGPDPAQLAPAPPAVLPAGRRRAGRPGPRAGASCLLVALPRGLGSICCSARAVAARLSAGRALHGLDHGRAASSPGPPRACMPSAPPGAACAP